MDTRPFGEITNGYSPPDLVSGDPPPTEWESSPEDLLLMYTNPMFEYLQWIPAYSVR